MLLAAEELQPDVIVADITMPSLNGLDAVRQLKKKNARAKVVFLTMHSDADLATEAFRAGASGYLLKQSAFVCHAFGRRPRAEGSGLFDR